MKPVISIIIPTYNRERDLKRALISVISQTFISWEVLVVDNHSSDNTDDLVKGFDDSRIRLLKIHNNGVIAASRNLGIENSSGDFIAFLDSDDWWKPNKLEESIKYLKNGVDLVYHSLFIVKKPNKKFFFYKMTSRALKKPIFDDLLVRGNTIANSSVVVKKSILDRVGPLSENVDLIAIEDFELWLRISHITDNFYMIPKVLGYYWAGGGNVSNPKRTLTSIQAFKNIYVKELNKIANNEPWWINYSRGRAHYLLGDYQKARHYLKRIQYRKASFLVFCKTVWMRLVAK